MKRFTRESFNFVDRIEGATRHSVILKGDDGEKIYCHLRIFDAIMKDPGLEFYVQTVPAHQSVGLGCVPRSYEESKWITAYIPTRR